MQKLTTLSAALMTAATMITAIPAWAAPETYVLDGTHTYPRFSYNHFGYSTQLSRFNKTTGNIILDPAAQTGAVDIVIDMTSVDTGYATFDEHIQGEDFLDTAQHPTATFKSDRVVFEGDRPVAVHGHLTLKGVTQPVTLTVTSFQAMPHPLLKKDAIGANAYTVVKRSDFTRASTRRTSATRCASTSRSKRLRNKNSSSLNPPDRSASSPNPVRGLTGCRVLGEHSATGRG